MDRDAFFAALWQDFVTIAPQAAAIRARFEALGERVENDHVAFRTFDRGAIALEKLEPLILGLGYELLEEYHFEEKRLRARAYLCEGSPRIFLSELLVSDMSQPTQSVIQRCVDQVAEPPASPEVFHAGRLWAPIAFAEYEVISKESEYAGWMCALGLHANHFTVSVNALSKLTSIEQVLAFVEDAGYSVNEAGGRVKGSKDVWLEQGSTLADRVEVEFQEGSFVVPMCYYEFALRHPLPDGSLFQGFVSKSADKIFESTDR